ncbi:hypothetical protein G4B88_027140 [Cannabis sativa]|uniref:NET domain-containing protein n=1 Tax=Cannabis sativa TaxID=3483 RepID=A0A7J6HST0_CANSA|nr:hypothetical protein G4B88_027140 [Cannabis sativa]
MIRARWSECKIFLKEIQDKDNLFLANTHLPFPNASSEHNRDGPDYFGYYKCQAQKLLTQVEDFQLFTSSKSSDFSGKKSSEDRGESDFVAPCSLFSNGVGDELSDFKRERLKTLLLQGVNSLTPEVNEVNGDDNRQLLIENDGPEVDNILKGVSDELSSKLGYMDQQLEQLLNIAVSVCRPMTIPEKKQLQKMIKGLPPKNLDRVVELVEHAEKKPADEIKVDLEKESNITLWRLYYYVQAVEKARLLSQ